MKRLNDTAGSLAVEFGVRGGTDVTGFGLLGHAWEIAQSSGVGLRFSRNKIPFISCAEKYASTGTFPGGAWDNMHYYEPKIKIDKSIPEERKLLLFDPQTSGGLLLGVSKEILSSFLSSCNEKNQPAWVIGEAVYGEEIIVNDDSME